MDYRMLITYIIVDIFCIIIVGVIKQNITTDSGSELEVRMLRRSLWSYIRFMVAGLTGLITENADLFFRNRSFFGRMDRGNPGTGEGREKSSPDLRG